MADGIVNRSQYFVERSGGGQAKSLNLNSAYHRNPPFHFRTALRSSLLVLEPLTERLDFRRRVRRKKVIDVDVGWGDQDRLGMCHRVEAIFAVIVSDP